MTRRKLVNIIKDAERVGHVTKGKIGVQSFDVGSWTNLRVLKQRFQLRAEDKRARRGACVVERLFSHPVAGDEKPARARVPDGEGKHPA